MIIPELLNDNTLIRRHSDLGMMMLQNETGKEYSEAVDIIPCRYTYTETDKPISEDEEATIEDYQEALNTLGVETE